MMFIVLFTIAICLVGIALQRTFLHPLSNFPGPWLGKFTELLSIVAVAQRRRTQNNDELLKRYGSCVRIGTNHLLYSSKDSIADIYGQSSNPCLKDAEMYKGLSVSGAINLLNAVDRDQHARLRRLASHSFSMQSLLESEDMFKDKIEEYLLVFQNDNVGRVNILERTYQLMLDIVSQLSFGNSFDCLTGQNQQALGDVQSFFTVIPPLSFAPILKHLPIKAIQEGRKGVARLHSFSRAHVESYISRHDKDDSTGKGKLFLENMAKAVDAETGTSLTQEELVENATIFLVAGVGTTAATMIYLIWECGRRPDVREKMIREIGQEFADPNIMPTYEKASRLKYLGWVIEETLRLRGPLNTGGPRTSPGKIIAGRWVPKGVTIETNIYTTARDPNVFSNPEDFDPSRWEHTTPDMLQMSRPFSYGPRSCIGRHLAEVILLLTVARLYQLYDVIPDPALTAEKMEQVDLGLLEPGCDEFFVDVKPHARVQTS